MGLLARVKQLEFAVAAEALIMSKYIKVGYCPQQIVRPLS
ncbi:hypothetical protein SynBIOSE41_01879 [Synechococcus sp. BIOS-E4-1]|nr:hypothetical protein SynBIOSE41_01879 [Synechococcus sp. BIOS-E4-1]